MARFLITTMPMKGHINPAIPIVQKLVKKHDVLWVMERKYLGDVKKSGAKCYSINNTFCHEPMDFNILNILRNYNRIKIQMRWVFVDYPLSQEKSIRNAIKRFNPSVILTDCIYITSLLIAKELNIPCAVLGVIPYPAKSRNTAPFGIGWQPTKTTITHFRNYFMNFISKYFLFKCFFEYVEEKADHFKNLFGKTSFFDIFTDLSDLYLQASINKLEYPRDNLKSKFHFIGPSIYKEPSIDILPEIIRQNYKKRPLVFVTQGTVDTDESRLLIPCLKGLAKKNVTLVMLVPKHKMSMSWRTPDNVIMLDNLQYHEIMPFTDIFITNGGFGGVQLALSYGVPLIIAGRSDDKGEVAARIAWSKCGINLKTSSPSPRSICSAVQKILSDKKIKLRAQEIKNIIKKENAPERACELLEELISSSG